MLQHYRIFSEDEDKPIELAFNDNKTVRELIDYLFEKMNYYEPFGMPIGRFKGTKEDFDFFGFTFYNTTTRTGKYRLGVRTSKKKLKAKKQAAKAWLKTKLTKPLAETMKILAAVIRGHCNYYGVNGNFHSIQNFWKYLKYSTYRMLNRRDQKGKFRYEKYLGVWNYYVSEPHLTTDIWDWSPMTV